MVQEDNFLMTISRKYIDDLLKNINKINILCKQIINDKIMYFNFLKFILIALSVFSFAIISTGLAPASSQLVTQFHEGPQIKDQNLKVELVSGGKIEFPTSMAFLGPNDILVLEKNNGTVKRVVNGSVLPEPLLDVTVANKHERGMLGIAVAPRPILNEDPKNSISNETGTVNVFLYYTESRYKDGEDVTDGKEPLGNRLYRYQLVNNKLVNPKLLLDLPTTPTAIHNGGKIAIGLDGNIYITTGDLGIFDLEQLPTQAQNIKEGKEADGSGGILKITQDGRPINGGILGNLHPLNMYYAYGIRNSFGIAMDPITGNLWDTENGPYNGDELNLVLPGFNSGWGKVQGTWAIKNQSIGRVFHEDDELVNYNGIGVYSPPKFVWNNTVGPTGIAFLNSTRLGKNYENDMFVGDFHNGYLYHFNLSQDRSKLSLQNPLGDKMANTREEIEKIIIAKGFGGITDLEIGPDGYLYVLSLHFGGRNCNPGQPEEPCVAYNGKNSGSIYRIVRVK